MFVYTILVKDRFLYQSYVLISENIDNVYHITKERKLWNLKLRNQKKKKGKLNADNFYKEHFFVKFTKNKHNGV